MKAIATKRVEIGTKDGRVVHLPGELFTCTPTIFETLEKGEAAREATPSYVRAAEAKADEDEGNEGEGNEGEGNEGGAGGESGTSS